MSTKYDRWIRHNYEFSDGQHVLWRDFRAAFLAWLPAKDRPHFTDDLISGLLPLSCPVGLGPRNQRIVGNLRSLAPQVTRRPPRWVRVAGGKVRLEYYDIEVG